MSENSSRENQNDIELTILMPCLNEAETLEVCIKKAFHFLEEYHVNGEVLIADNGSTDGSQEIARRCGARVADVPVKGYGAALMGGCDAAYGRYVIMGDADDSYDFLHLMPFLEKLREGYDLVMGNRFKGGIAKGAMPWSHRYIGNPILSFIGRLFYPSAIGDFHCGLRGYNRESIQGLDLQTTGMEYASEMVVKATLMNLKMAEVPTTLAPDGRSRPPHLRSFRDGWRHLKFLLMHSPKWLFLYPGAVFFILGLIMMVALLPGPLTIGSVSFDIHTMLVGSGCMILGAQTIQFALFTNAYAKVSGFIPVTQKADNLLEKITTEKGALLGVILVLIGLVAAIASVIIWKNTQFGDLDPQQVMRYTIPAMTCIVIGVQFIFGSFFLGILKIRHK